MAERVQIESVDIGNNPELVALAEEVQRTHKPRILRRGDASLALLTPVKNGRIRIRTLRGKPFTEDDALWNIAGIAISNGPTDVATNKHGYLAEAYADPHAPKEE